MTDPWSMHVARFRILDAQLTAIPESEGMIAQHGMTILVEEGRAEVRRDLENADSTAAALEYFCRATVAGAPAPDSWSGTDAKIVVTGRHENGWRVALAGDGLIGRDNNGNLEAEFDRPPQIAVDEV